MKKMTFTARASIPGSGYNYDPSIEINCDAEFAKRIAWLAKQRVKALVGFEDTDYDAISELCAGIKLLKKAIKEYEEYVHADEVPVEEDDI